MDINISIDYYGPIIKYDTIEYIIATLLFIALLIIYNKKSNKNNKTKNTIVNILFIAIFISSMILASSQYYKSPLALFYTYGYLGYKKALAGTILYGVLIVTMIIVCIFKHIKSKKTSKGEIENGRND